VAVEDLQLLQQLLVVLVVGVVLLEPPVLVWVVLRDFTLQEILL
jgi:hypothetical protein